MIYKKGWFFMPNKYSIVFSSGYYFLYEEIKNRLVFKHRDRWLTYKLKKELEKLGI